MIICVAVTIVLFKNEWIHVFVPILFLALVAFVLAKSFGKTGFAEMLAVLYPVISPTINKLFLGTAVVDWLRKQYLFLLQDVFHLSEQIDQANFTDELIISITFSAFYIVFLFLPRRKKAKAGSKDIEFKRRFDAYAERIDQTIQHLNREANWQEESFSPIEAEVHVIVKGKQKRKYSDLMKCLKKRRKQDERAVFFVLGDPGTGKSVSLRKLCKDMLKDSKKTGILPVYINLKHWSNNWTNDRPPSEKDLLVFIRRSMSEEIYDPDGFLEQYFDELRQKGKWYFIFDSFDELPCLMGRKNVQELIEKLSDLLYRFMTGPDQNGGILASRKFHSPVSVDGSEVFVILQEFDDYRIKTMLERYFIAGKTVSKMFSDREDLVMLCRNPFILSLLIQYIKNNGGEKLPENQLQLYSNFFDSGLKRISGYLEEHELQQEQVMDYVMTMVEYMYSMPGCSLECPIKKLQEKDNTIPWKNIVDALDRMNICRFGGMSQSVTFIHRRFQEYFLVKGLQEGSKGFEKEAYQDILDQTGMRDALVLYCDIASSEKIAEIADYCFQSIIENYKGGFCFIGNENRDSIRKLVNTLGFMADAFQHTTIQDDQRHAFDRFNDIFDKVILEMIGCSESYVVCLAAANCVGLLKPENREMCVQEALSIDDKWLNDLVMKKCRLFPSISQKSRIHIQKYLESLPLSVFFRRFRSMQFSFSLSKNLRKIRIAHFALLATHCMLALTIIFNMISFLRLVPQVSGFVLVVLCGFLMISFASVLLYYRNGLAMMFLSFVEIGWWLCNTIIVSYLYALDPYAIGWLSVIITFFMIQYLDRILYRMSEEYRTERKKAKAFMGKNRLREFTILLVKALIFDKIWFWGKGIPLGFVFTLVLVMVACYLDHHYTFFTYLAPLWFLVFIGIGIRKEDSMVGKLFASIEDKRFLKSQEHISKISREAVFANLERIHLEKYKIAYLDMLIQAKVELFGDWPEEMSDNIDYIIDEKYKRRFAILEYAHESLSVRFY